jgi:riboflavin synthase
MFTGIVEEIGSIASMDVRTGATSLVVNCQTPMNAIHIGDSIAVNGVCLTVVDLSEHGFTTEAVPETLHRTNLGNLNRGSPVNLERSLTLDRSMGGHYVQGHIDGIARIARLEPEGEAINYYFETSPELLRYIVPKGFVAVDGASLTVVNVDAQGFSVTLIPHTQQWTVMGKERVGYQVNIEVDIMGKYIEKLMGERLSSLDRRIVMLETATHLTEQVRLS